MLEFILQIILMIGLSGMVLIVARAVPRVSDKEASEVKFEEWLKKLPIERVDNIIRSVIYKVLRRVRLVLLKIDNKIGEYLERTKNSSDISDRSMDKFLSKSEK